MQADTGLVNIKIYCVQLDNFSHGCSGGLVSLRKEGGGGGGVQGNTA